MDVFPSFGSFANTMNHGVKPDYEYEERFPEWWDWWIRTYVPIYKAFHDSLLNHLTKERKSILFYFV